MSRNNFQYWQLWGGYYIWGAPTTIGKYFETAQYLYRVTYVGVPSSGQYRLANPPVDSLSITCPSVELDGKFQNPGGNSMGEIMLLIVATTFLPHRLRLNQKLPNSNFFTLSMVNILLAFLHIKQFITIHFQTPGGHKSLYSTGFQYNPNTTFVAWGKEHFGLTVSPVNYK